MSEGKDKKYKVVILDTINQIQNNQYMNMLDENTMVTRDKWKDFGVDIYMLLEHLKKLNCEIVLVLGYEGSGKSYGIKGLNPETTMWIHADNKPITFKGGRQNYDSKKGNFTVPKTYERVKEIITGCNDRKANKDKPLLVFITGHIEDYKTNDGDIRQRLKTLGAFASKMNIEGAVSNCFYTDVQYIGDNPKYRLRLANNGSDTCRALESLFDTTYIDNNFGLVAKAIANY